MRDIINYIMEVRARWWTRKEIIILNQQNWINITRNEIISDIFQHDIWKKVFYYILKFKTTIIKRNKIRSILSKTL